MSVEIAPVAGRRDLDRFLHLPWRIYRRSHQWVPPLLDHQRHLLDRRHPFHRHADVELFLARRRGVVVGRIAAIVNHRHVAVHDEPVGFFGFFESAPDGEVTAALLEAAEHWLGVRGMRAMRGPMSFSTNEECGMLVDGFEAAPAFMMPYNPPYYPKLMEQAGLRKAVDLLTYRGGRDSVTPHRRENLERLAERVRRHLAADIRVPDLRRFDDELAQITAVYHRAWSRNWGFVPMTDEEIAELGAQLRPLVDPELIRTASVGGLPVGVGLMLPNYNEPIKHLNGRLWPFGAPYILASRYLRRIRGTRLLMLGVVPEYQRRGLDALLLHELYDAALRRGYDWCEVGWVLEENHVMNNAIRSWGLDLSARYRVYERAFAAGQASAAGSTMPPDPD